MRNGGRFLCSGLLALVVSLSASALDAVDIGQMLSNAVQESVIVNMIQSQKLARPLQAGEIIDLKNAGASNTLLEILTNPDNVLVVMSPQTDEKTVVVETYDPGPIVVQSPPVVVESPPVIYTRPPGYPGYYNGWPYRHDPHWGNGFSFGLHFGRPLPPHPPRLGHHRPMGPHGPHKRR